MGLYNFQSRFVDPILAGRKTHTIRAPRANPDKPGNTLHLYTGLRQKGAKLLMRVPCVRVEEIEIWWHGKQWETPKFFVRVDRQLLAPDEREALAERDGFQNFAEMMQFWKERLPFRGQIIHWRKAA